jgi:hypothetical protein
MRLRRGVMVMLLLVLMALAAPGWTQTLRFHRGNSGLVDNFVNRILILNGLPAVCTEGGLTIIHPDHLESWKRGELAFPDAGVSAAVFYNGRIWIGTNGKGLARFEENKWKSFATSDSGLGDNFVTALTVWGNRLLVGTREGLFFFDGLLWDKVILENGRPYVVSALLTMNSLVYVGSNRGLLRLENRAAPTLTSVNVPFPSRVTALAAENGILYAAHENGVISLPPSGAGQTWTLESRTGARIVDLIPNQGVLLVGTSRGLFAMKPDGSVRQASFAGMPAGASAITALVRGGGYIWIGLEGEGILRVSDHETVIEGHELAAAVGSRPSSETNVAPGETRSIGAPPVSGKTEPDGIKFSNVRVFAADDAHVPARPSAAPSNANAAPTLSSAPQGSSSVPGWGTIAAAPNGVAPDRVVVPAPPIVRTPAIVTPAATPTSRPAVSTSPRPAPTPVTPTSVPGWGTAAPPSGSPPLVIKAQTAAVPQPSTPVAPAPSSAGLPVGWGVVAGTAPQASPVSPPVVAPAISVGAAAPAHSTGVPGWGTAAAPAGSPPLRIVSPASPAPSANAAVIPAPVLANPSGALPGWGAVPTSPANAVSAGGGNLSSKDGDVPEIARMARPFSGQTVSWSRSVWPMMQRTCMACHTSGTGSYFPLADQGNVKAYFRREGMKRYDAAAQAGRGMSGVSPAADTQLLRTWVNGGMSE